MLLEKRISLGKRLNSIFSKPVDTDILSEVEELLITADFGIELSDEIIREFQDRARRTTRKDFPSLLKSIVKERMTIRSLDVSKSESPSVSRAPLSVILVFGVNGTGKTTTVGKLAYYYKQQGKRVLVAAADTYRDAAIDQLTVWCNRAGVPIIKQYQGSDPGAVVFDSCDSARSRNVQFLIIDTAGRLHNKKQLMEELSKIGRIVDKKLPESDVFKILTLDATTGQNGISQASQFKEYIGVDGIILTKLDSSAKGGIACSVSGKLAIPILFAGTGEGIDDLAEFDVDTYLDELFTGN
jgi:fused signal recognition particle receptor